uniref:Tc1-like transposase DDE domain-containing protein n=1 Tax=Naja naja TaxID=35670 RepID=A0A8C6XBH6_NAJNA
MKAFAFTSTEQQHHIIVLHEEGYSCTEIAKRVKCHSTTVSRVVEKYQITGSVDDRLRSGRPRKSTKHKDQALQCISMADRKLTSPQITRIWGETCDVKVGTTTVCCKLLAIGLKGCRVGSKPLLTDVHHSRRCAWAKKFAKWTNEQWAKVIFSDENNFYLTGNQCNKYVRRFPAEEFRPYCLNLSVKHPLHVMIWGCITASGIGRMQIVQGIMNSKQYVEVLEKTMLPSAQQLIGKDFYFQDDNAPCHRAKSVQQWMKKHGVRLLDWPAQSPDLNLTENLWAKIGYEISKKHLKTKQELTESIIAAWHYIVTKDHVQRLIQSMTK